MTDTQLKPCPFCGSTNLVIDTASLYRWYVECWDCEAAGPFADDEAGAAEAWNKREDIRIDPSFTPTEGADE